VYVNEGLGALWKGVGATVVGVMPARAIYFSTYTRGKHLYTQLNGGRETPLVHLASAATAGVATATATNPIWMVKTKMQLQQSNHKGGVYKNSLDCAVKIYQAEGVRGLYKGLTASYIGIAESTMQWMLYEKLKKELALHRAHQRQVHDPSFEIPATISGRAALLSWLDVFGVAAASKLIAAALSYPHEVLRTRLREDSSKYRGLVQTTRRIWAEEGAAAFYGGMTAHLLRVVPNSAIMFFSYELMLATYSRLYPDH
jgi:solute carrier family 25 protein 33/36